MAIITATTRVSFQADETTGALSLLIDDRETVNGGLNGGETTFYPGDTVHILRFMSPALTEIQVGTTAGNLSSGVSGNYAVVGEILIFSDAKEASLSKPTSAISGGSGNTATGWIGPSQGTYNLQNNTKIVLPEKVFGVLRVNYTAPYTAYALTNTTINHPDVLVYAQADDGNP